jgi:hypothetical protein
VLEPSPTAWAQEILRRSRRSRKQERDGAKRYGGTVNAQSGAGDIRKNDVRTGTESIEFKGTTRQGYRLTVADLIKAWSHATLDDRTMIFGIEFFPSALNTFSPGSPTRYVVMTENDYLAMRDNSCCASCGDGHCC